MRYACALLLLLLTACTAGYVPDPAGVLSAQPAQAQALPTDLNVAQGIIDGQRTSTAQAAWTQVAAQNATEGAGRQAAQATRDAAAMQLTMQAGQAAQYTAIAQATRQYQQAQGTANAIAMLSAEQQATVTGWAQAARSTDTFATLTVGQAITRAETERANRERNGQVIAWALGIILAALGVVVVVLVYRIGQQGHRIAQARARAAEADAMNAGIKIIPQVGFVFVMPGMARPQFQPWNPAQLPAAVPQTFEQVVDRRKLADLTEFMRLVQEVTHKPFATYIPRHNWMGISANEWTEWTNELERRGYIRKEARKQTNCIDEWNAQTIIDDLGVVQYSPSVNVSRMPGD